jgi:hypothetical protein
MPKFNEQVVETYPAWDIVERQKTATGLTVITARETLALRGASPCRIYYASSVMTYAIESGNCPIEALDRAREHGHQTHWISPRASALTAWKQPREKHVAIEIGMRILFEGRIFEVGKCRSPDHLSMKDLGVATLADRYPPQASQEVTP